MIVDRLENRPRELLAFDDQIILLGDWNALVDVVLVLVEQD